MPDAPKVPETEIPEVPKAPRFISEGTAREIEINGSAVDPFDGSKLTKADLPAGRK